VVADRTDRTDYRCEIDTAIVGEKQESADVNGRWEHLKSTVINAAELTLGHKTREEVRKPWVTDEMIDTGMIEERRKWKSIHSEEGGKKYKSLNNRLSRITDKPREKCWDEQCAELEKHERQGKIQEGFKVYKQKEEKSELTFT